MPHVTAEELTTPDSLQMARELFQVASSQQGSAREAILANACNGNGKLRAFVERMLEADGLECPVLDRPLSADLPAPTGLKPGDCVGPYRVVRELGTGGMGAVYQVEREGLPGLLALKLVRWLSPENWQRFQQEKSILSNSECIEPPQHRPLGGCWCSLRRQSILCHGIC